MNISSKTAYELYVEDEAKKSAVLDHKKIKEMWNKNIHIRNLWHVKEKEQEVGK